MISLYRGLSAGLLVAALAALCAPTGEVAAQDKDKDKKDAKKDAKKDDLREKSVGFATSDGLTLSGYWFQGNAIDKQLPDAVMMFPAPGSKVNESWVSLARALSEKNFSVLLFDWRGCGMNGPAGTSGLTGAAQGERILVSKGAFWKDPYNELLLKSKQATIEKTGLTFSQLLGAGNGRDNYRAFLLNDLLAARFYLDQQDTKCNTRRTWIVSEKDGAHVGLAFIATEFQRNAIFKPDKNVGDLENQNKAAGREYAGLMALSFSPSGTYMNSVANTIFNNTVGLKPVDFSSDPEMPITHLQDRLAMVLLHSKKEGPDRSKSAALLARVTGAKDEMERKFKYIREIDVKAAKPLSGVDMIDATDSFGVRETVVKAMVEISKVQNFGKAPRKTNAGEMADPPRFHVERYIRR